MSNKKEKVAAVVVTYNRKDLLKECLNAILRQKKQPDSIIIINNASNDGTEKMLKSNFLKKDIFDYVRLEKNTGSSGGQYVGIKRAYKKGFDWVWCMDDDTIPEEKTLKELLKGKAFLTKKRVKNIGFLCSKVYGLEGNSMNVPSIETKSGKEQGPQWEKYIDKGIARVKSSTFVSVMFSRKAIRNCGLPIKEMFIWGDDSEYTRRISNKYNCYLIGKSKALHKREIQKRLNILTEKNKERIKNYFYHYRNNLYNRKKYGGIFKAAIFILASIKHLVESFFSPPHILKRFTTIAKGVFSGLFFTPKIRKLNQ